jgi:hypothetical protein
MYYHSYQSRTGCQNIERSCERIDTELIGRSLDRLATHHTLYTYEARPLSQSLFPSRIYQKLLMSSSSLSSLLETSVYMRSVVLSPLSTDFATIRKSKS